MYKVVPVIVDRDQWTTKSQGRFATIRLIKLWDSYLGYLVEWMDGVERWESRNNLLEKLTVDEARGVLLWCQMIDRFMRDEEEILLNFMRSDAFGKSYAGADLDGLCGFRAVENALAYLNAPQLVSKDRIHEYCSRVWDRSKRQINIWKTGMTFQQIVGFVRDLPSARMTLRMGENLYRGSRNGWKGAQDVIREDGIYLVCGHTDYIKTGHVIVVKKEGNRLIAKDERGEQELSSQVWIKDISYVRRATWSPK
jgi:hypothetical protein